MMQFRPLKGFVQRKYSTSWDSVFMEKIVSEIVIFVDNKKCKGGLRPPSRVLYLTLELYNFLLFTAP